MTNLPSACVVITTESRSFLVWFWHQCMLLSSCRTLPIAAIAWPCGVSPCPTHNADIAPWRSAVTLAATDIFKFMSGVCSLEGYWESIEACKHSGEQRAMWRDSEYRRWDRDNMRYKDNILLCMLIKIQANGLVVHHSKIGWMSLDLDLFFLIGHLSVDDRQ
jgi:hypothetical protein